MLDHPPAFRDPEDWPWATVRWVPPELDPIVIMKTDLVSLSLLSLPTSDQS